MQAGCFPRHALDHHGDGHTGGEAVRVKHNVWDETRFREWEVLGYPLLGTNSLLTSTGCELVAYCWVTLKKKALLNTQVTVLF